jgi:hypothetical protein
MHSTLKWKYTKKGEISRRVTSIFYSQILDVLKVAGNASGDGERTTPGHGTNYYDTLRQQQHLLV